jgi:Epoxide hydrolase N terminus
MRNSGKEVHMPVTTEDSAGGPAIRPFTIEVPEAELEDLRARIRATRWPERETVEDFRRACNSPSFKRSRGIGRQNMIGVHARRD